MSVCELLLDTRKYKKIKFSVVKLLCFLTGERFLNKKAGTVVEI